MSEGIFCQHGGSPDRCIVCNPKTGDPSEWNETVSDKPKDAMQDWKYEVENGDTVLGYAEWVSHKEEEDEFENA
jgi:hypothetical protein